MFTLTISVDAELQLISSTPMPPASPVAQRRDSILKHQNSVKTDKRVSIKQGSGQKSGSSKLQMTSNLEYISEKPSSLSSSASTLPSSGSTTLERRPSKTTGILLQIFLKTCKYTSNVCFFLHTQVRAPPHWSSQSKTIRVHNSNWYVHRRLTMRISRVKCPRRARRIKLY